GSGIKTVSDLRGKSLLFGPADSTLTYWAKVCLSEAGLRASDLVKYRHVDAQQEWSKGAGVTPVQAEGPALGNAFSDMTPVEAVVQGTYDAGVAMEKRFLQVAAR